jgi:diguanylate cyclase (GGDEF)-like protein
VLGKYMNFINNKTQKILIVDDILKNIQIVMEVLENKGYKLSFAKTPQEAIKRAQTNDIDLILLDIMMPNINGYEVCKILKSFDETKDIPIIFITAKTDAEDIVRGFEAGGVDYITKPFNSSELLARVQTHLELKASRDYWKKRSMLDGLTSLYNHTYINQHLFRQIKHSQATEESLSVIMVDIDYFKKINDTYGHQIGDKVIVKIASTLENTVSKLNIENAIAGRYGGEEFTIIIPTYNKEQATDLAEELRKKIEALEWNIDELKLTISCGVKEYAGETSNEVLKEADLLLYKAKHNGRNRVES